MSKIIDFKRRKPPSSSLEDLYYHPIILALQDLPPCDRISAIAAACDDDDLKELAQLAAWTLGPAILDEIRKVLDQAFGGAS